MIDAEWSSDGITGVRSVSGDQNFGSLSDQRVFAVGRPDFEGGIETSVRTALRLTELRRARAGDTPDG